MTKEEKKLNQLETKAHEAFLKYEEANKKISAEISQFETFDEEKEFKFLSDVPDSVKLDGSMELMKNLDGTKYIVQNIPEEKRQSYFSTIDALQKEMHEAKQAWEEAEAAVEEYSDEIDEALSFPEITSYGNYDVPPDSQCPPNSLYVDSHEKFLKRKSLHSKPEEQVQRPIREFFNS